jgi:nicotinamide mononucleotide transporter
MNTTEIIAVIFSFLSAILTIRKNILCWSTGFLGAICYTYVLLKDGIYAGAFMQFVFAVQSISGFILWKLNKQEEGEIKVKIIDKKTFLFSMLIFFVLWILTAKFFIEYTDNKYPLVDSFASLFALLANYYLTKRFLQNWIFWVISDFVFILIFIDAKLYLSALLYAIFFLIASFGYISWRKDLKKHEDFYGI